MKKIITAAAIAAMAGSSLFAADAKITLNHRTKLDAFSYVKKEAGDVTTKSTEWMDWSGYDGEGYQKATANADNFKFVLDGEKAGVTVLMNFTSDKPSAPVVLNQYSAWAKWGLPVGELKIEAGNWKDGYADGSYRVKKNADDGNLEGVDLENFKLGSVFAGTAGLKFVDDLAQGLGQKAQSGFAEYSVNPTDDIALKVLIGGTYDTFDKVTDDDDSKDVSNEYYDSRFASRIQFNYANLFKSEFIYKKPAPRYNDFALYVKPVLLDGLDVTVGFAAETYSAADSDDDYTSWGFDLRARYASGNFSITTFNNISTVNLDEGLGISAGFAGHKGAEGYVGQTTEVNKTKINDFKFRTVMWNELGARYKINDLVTLHGSVGLLTPLSKAKGDDNSYSPEWRVTPAVQIYAASNASVFAGVAISGSSWTVDKTDDDYSVVAVQVPVVFRVKM